MPLMDQHFSSLASALDGIFQYLIHLTGMLVHEHVTSHINRLRPSEDEWDERVKADEGRVQRMRKQWPKRKKVKQEVGGKVRDEANSSDSSSPGEQENADTESDKDDMEIVSQESDKESSD